MFEYNVTFIYNNATDNKIGGVIVLSYFFPSSFDLFIQPTIASMILFLKPSFSSIATASIVVPAGEQTISFNFPGCLPVSSNIFALPSTACAANVYA